MFNNILLTETGTLWLGTESSYHATISAYQKMAEEGNDGYKKECFSQDQMDAEDDDEHFLLEIIDGVGLITIRGSMVPGSEGARGAYWGIVGYDDIRNAIISAINAGVESIFLDYDTPGGAVKGIMELSDFIKSLEVKTTSFTGGIAASGGLWLATAADKFYAARMAEVGSLGVLAVTAEMTEMYKDIGINLRVFKSTPLKAAGNPYEKLTDEAAAQIQKNLDETHQFFVREIAENRGLTDNFVSENIANGKVWFAAEANELRLIDGISTFDDLLLVLLRETADNTNDFKQVQDNDMATRRKILTEQESAAIASGANVETVLEEATPALTVEDEGTSKDDASNTADDKSTDNKDTPDAGKDNADTEVSATAPEKEITVIEVFQEQISAQQDVIVDLKVELKQAQAKVTALEATHNGLKDVTAAATQRHFVAVGAPAPSLEGLLALDSSALLEQHSTALALVVKRYPTSGQVSVPVEDKEDEAVAAAAKVTNDILLKQARI